MLKKILFLLSALFFYINVFSSDLVQQKPKWLDYDIPQEITFKIISYCDLADFGNCKLVCKYFNTFDLNTLICLTHQEINHKCSSSHLSDLTKDYDRCTHILHCIANRKNLTNSVKFNSQLEENLFFMIYFLHKREREKLIQEIYPYLKQKLFTNKIRRDYYQYTESNTKDMLVKAIKHNKFIRIKQILQSPNQYIKKIITTIDNALINTIHNILELTTDIIDIQNVIELLLSADNDTNTKQQHDLWQKMMLILLYKNTYKHKKTLIDFLLSEKFNYLNPYFSADFYTKKNGFLSFCDENDFDLISNRCDKETIFDPKEIRCLSSVCANKNHALSLKIVQWLISKNCKFPQDHNKVVKKAYKSGNINLVKLLIQKGMSYYKVISTICIKNDIDLATWILDNYNKNDKFIYNDDFIYVACLHLNVEIVQLLFTKKMPIDFYKSYGVRDTLFNQLLEQGYDYFGPSKYEKECCEIITLFLENGFDAHNLCKTDKERLNRIKKSSQFKNLPQNSNKNNIKDLAQPEKLLQNSNGTNTQYLKPVTPQYKTLLATIKSIFNMFLNELLKFSKHIRLNLY